MQAKEFMSKIDGKFVYFVYLFNVKIFRWNFFDNEIEKAKL